MNKYKIITTYKRKYFHVIRFFCQFVNIINKYIQTQYFIEQFYMELGEFEDIQWWQKESGPPF